MQIDDLDIQINDTVIQINDVEVQINASGAGIKDLDIQGDNSITLICWAINITIAHVSVVTQKLPTPP